MPKSAKQLVLLDTSIRPGETRDLQLPLTQSYSGTDVMLPLRVIRGSEPGPVVLLSAALHGDELNGTGIIREILMDPSFDLLAGTLILVPVLNIPGFERQTRYLPDRRDLNRCFPGSRSGSVSRRVAYRIFNELVVHCDYCVDFHTAAVHRTNYPHVRGDLAHEPVERLARAFGCEIIVDSQGPKGSLRQTATAAGHPTILIEAGEVWKVEPTVVTFGLRGIQNLLVALEMVDGKREEPAYQARVSETRWLRTEAGGMLRFHVGPGELVETGQPLASCTTLLGTERDIISAPFDGVVLGLTTLPTVKPGDPVCHLALPRRGISRIRRALHKLPAESLHERIMDDLATSVSVEDALEAVEWEDG